MGMLEYNFIAIPLNSPAAAIAGDVEAVDAADARERIKERISERIVCRQYFRLMLRRGPRDLKAVVIDVSPGLCGEKR